jgi:hypothetical protein
VTAFDYRSRQLADDISELKATVIAAASVGWRLCSTSSRGHTSATVTAGISPVIRTGPPYRPGGSTAGRAFYEGDIADEPLINRILAEHTGIGVVSMARR